MSSAVLLKQNIRTKLNRFPFLCTPTPTPRPPTPPTSQLGQHNFSAGMCERTKRMFGFIVDDDPLSAYGVGIGLYFKMLKVLLVGTKY